MPKKIDSMWEAFSAAREQDRPLAVVVGGWKGTVFPSGAVRPGMPRFTLPVLCGYALYEATEFNPVLCEWETTRVGIAIDKDAADRWAGFGDDLSGVMSCA